MSHFIGLFGNIPIAKAVCAACRGYYFVLENQLACCGRFVETVPTHYKREVEAEQRRRQPSRRVQDAILAAQNGLCFYCSRRLGSDVFRGSRRVRLLTHWDHMVPYSYSQDNRGCNFVAACHVCNLSKRDLCFPTVDDARVHLELAWTRKGYSDLPPPDDAGQPEDDREARHARS